MPNSNFFRTFFSIKTDKTKGEVGIHRALGVGVWDMFNSGSGGLIGSWLLYFLTTFGGLNPGIAAVLISVRLFIDMIWAPIVAVISDNFYHFAIGRKFGRRRFFLIFTIPTSCAFVLMWIPLTASWSWLYYLIAMVVFDFCLDLILIPWETLPAEMTESFTQRNKMGTVRMWSAGLAQPLIALVPSIFMQILPAPEGMKVSPWALFATALCWGIMGILFTFFVFISSWDPIHTSKAKRDIILANLQAKRQTAQSPFIIIAKNFANLGLTLRIKTFRKHLVLYFSTFGVIDSYTTIFVIFASVSFLPTLTIDPAQAGIILAIPLLIMTFVYSPIGAWLLNQPRIGPRVLYIFGFGIILLACTTYGITYFLRNDLSAQLIWLLVVVGHCVFTIGRQIMGGIPWVVFPMMADIDEIISRDKRAGIFAGAMTFVRKFTNAVFNILIGIVMSIAGYNQTVSQTADKISKFATDHKGVSIQDAYNSVVNDLQLQQQFQSAGFGITMLMVFFVGGLLIWALWNAATFKLNLHTHNILISEIKRLRQAGTNEQAIQTAKEKVNPNTKNIVEQLTGLDYDKYVWTGE